MSGMRDILEWLWNKATFQVLEEQKPRDAFKGVLLTSKRPTQKGHLADQMYQAPISSPLPFRELLLHQGKHPFAQWPGNLHLSYLYKVPKG